MAKISDAELVFLAKFCRANWRSVREDELPDHEDFDNVCGMISTFLQDLCIHDGLSKEATSCITEAVFSELLARLDAAVTSSYSNDKKFLLHTAWLRRDGVFWLVRTARKFIDNISAAKKMAASPVPAVLLPDWLVNFGRRFFAGELVKPSRLWKQTCPLRPRPTKYNCRINCDLEFFLTYDFPRKDIERFLKIKRGGISRNLERCSAKADFHRPDSGGNGDDMAKSNQDKTTGASNSEDANSKVRLNATERQRRWDQFQAVRLWRQKRFHALLFDLKTLLDFPRFSPTQKLAVGAFAAILLIGVLSLGQFATIGTIQMTARDNVVIERGFGTSLPILLIVDFKKLTASVSGDGELLRGTLVPLPNESNSDEEVFSADMTGLDSDGISGEFTGRVRVIRTSPNAAINKLSNIQRIILNGDFKVGTGAPQVTSRAYYP